MSLFTKLLKKSLKEYFHRRKKWLIGISVFIGILIGINYMLNSYVYRVVGTLIREFVAEKSNGFYEVNFDEIGYIINNGRFLVTEFEFKVHADHEDNVDYSALEQRYIYTASIPRMHIDIIDFWSIFVRKKLRVIGIEIFSPTIKVLNLNKNKSSKKISFEAGNLYQALSEHLQELKINDFSIQKGNFDFETYQGPDYDNFKIEGLTFQVKNFQVNEKAALSDDKFFYTDDIYLEINNQELFLKDSIHKVTFGKFYLSTRNNELGFDRFRLTRRDSIRSIKDKKDHYEIGVPQLRLDGIDFISAYNDNFLLIDSILINRPTINLTKRTKSSVKEPDRNGLLDIAMMYHDYLEINHFNLSDAHLTFQDETSPQTKTYNIDHISTKVSYVKIDTGQSSTHPYGVNFGSVDLSIQDYEVTLPDSSSTIKFEELSIASDPVTITLKDLVFEPKNHDPSLAKPSISAKVPYFVITGFDISKAINRDTIIIDECYFEYPEIAVTTRNAPSTNKDKKSQAGLFGLFDQIKSITNLFKLNRLDINNGKFTLKAGDEIKNLDLDHINVSLENLKVDSLTNHENSFIGDASLGITLGSSTLQTKMGIIDFERLDFASDPGYLQIDTLQYLSDTTSNNLQTRINLPKARITGIDLDQILFDPHILLDTLQFEGTDFQANKSGEAINSSSSKMNIDLPTISIAHMISRNNNIDYREKNLPVYIAKTIDMQVTNFKIDRSLSSSPKNQFDYESMDLLSVKEYDLYLHKQNHLFHASDLLWTENYRFSMENIQLTPYGNPNNQYNIRVPKISMTGIDLKKILKESYYDSDEIIIENPSLFLKLAAGRQEKLTSLDLGFIPLLLRNQFLGVKANNFKLNDGTINFRQKSNQDSLIVECDLFSLTVENFEVDSTTEMVPDRFLFANDVRLNGEYLTFYQKERSNFYNINHFDISTKEQDLLFEGIYYGTNTKGDIPNKGKTTMSVDFLNIMNLDFYELTQNKSIRVDKIGIDNAAFNLLPKPKEEKDQDLNRSNNEPLDDDNLSDQTQTTESKRVFKIHEQNYLFDTLLLKNINIGQILITDSNVKIENPEEHKNDLVVPDIWLLAEGIKYNPVAALDSNRIFYSDNIMAKFTNLNYMLPDNLTSVKINELNLNSSDSTIGIKNFMLVPQLSKFDYGPAKGYQATWLKIENETISLNKVDFLGILNNKTLTARTVDIDGVDFEIYRDKRIPFPEWQRRPLPQVELTNIDFTINIDTVNLHDSYIGYLEHAEKSNSPGEVFFNDLNAKIFNITNDPQRIQNSPKTNISASANVFGKGKIKAEFQFDMLNPDHIHTYGIEVDSFDLTEFNRILIPNASAQVKSGHNNKIIMTARANERYSYGEMRFYYNDLKVQLLNQETETPKGLGNILGSFFANTFIIRTNNPKNFVLRKGDIFFERDKKRAIFNYWTKTFLSGIVSSIGAANNKKKIKKMQEESLKEIEEIKSTD